MTGDGYAELLAEISEDLAASERREAALMAELRALRAEAAPAPVPGAQVITDAQGRRWVPVELPPDLARPARWTPDRTARYDAIVRGAARRRGYTDPLPQQRTLEGTGAWDELGRAWGRRR